MLRNKFRFSSKNQAQKVTSALPFLEDNHRMLSQIPNILQCFSFSFPSKSFPSAPPQSSGVFPWDLQLLGSPLFPLSPFTPLGLPHLPHFPSSHPTFNPGHWMILRVFSHLGDPAVFPSQGKQGIVFGVLSVGMMVPTSPRRMKSFPRRAFPK